VALANIFNDASSAMTVVSFLTFIGILWWSFMPSRKPAFDEAARLPFADDEVLMYSEQGGLHHG
jgi:cytochrome c oxidase cbb3-type subunit 4